MTKTELIGRINKAFPHLLHRDSEKIIDMIFEEIIAALARGEKVELRDFGVFITKQRAARTGRNPQTGAPIAVPAKLAVVFKAGKLLRKRVQ